MRVAPGSAVLRYCIRKGFWDIVSVPANPDDRDSLAVSGMVCALPAARTHCNSERASELPDPAVSYMAGTQGVGTRRRLPTVLKPLSELVSAAERRASNNRPAMVWPYSQGLSWSGGST